MARLRKEGEKRYLQTPLQSPQTLPENWADWCLQASSMTKPWAGAYLQNVKFESHNANRHCHRVDDDESFRVFGTMTIGLKREIFGLVKEVQLLLTPNTPNGSRHSFGCLFNIKALEYLLCKHTQDRYHEGAASIS